MSKLLVGDKVKLKNGYYKDLIGTFTGINKIIGHMVEWDNGCVSGHEETDLIRVEKPQ